MLLEDQRDSPADMVVQDKEGWEEMVALIGAGFVKLAYGNHTVTTRGY